MNVKTKTIITILVIAVKSFSGTATAQGYDYPSTPDSIKVEKVYPAVIFSPEQFRKLYDRDANGNLSPEKMDDGSFRIDSTNAYFRMIERTQRLPGPKLDKMNPDEITNHGAANRHEKKKIQ
jgi:hypothetical protein